MCTYLSQIIPLIEKSISEKMIIDDIDDFAVFNASFIFDNFQHLEFDNPFLQLGIYRVGKYESGFYCQPYVHYWAVSGDYYPYLEEIPAKKTFLQKIGLAKSPKKEYRITSKYKSGLSINEIIPEELTKYIPSPLHHIIVKDWYRAGIWEAFVLDNLRYMLPAFGHGNYKYRKFITSLDDLQDLPDAVKDKTAFLRSNILPAIWYEDTTATITVHYFNNWEGLVRWDVEYTTCADDFTAVCVQHVVSPKEKKTVLIPYDCRRRF